MTHTVLIIEDDGDIVASMDDFLRTAGYDVMSAANGRDALELLDRVTTVPSLILLDLLMPVMDGYEFLQELRQRPRLASIPVVVISAASTIGAPFGFPVLKKPFGLTTFLDTVKAHCAP